jgi:hypothetical protein
VPADTVMYLATQNSTAMGDGYEMPYEDNAEEGGVRGG